MAAGIEVISLSALLIFVNGNDAALKLLPSSALYPLHNQSLFSETQTLCLHDELAIQRPFRAQ